MQTQSSGQTGSVTGGSGTIIAAAVTNVALDCEDLVSVSTLAGTGEAGHLDGLGTLARCSEPSALVVDRDRAVYAGDAGKHRISGSPADGMVGSLAPNGTSAHADGRGDAARFDGASGLDVEPDGSRLHMADMANNRLRSIGNTP